MELEAEATAKERLARATEEEEADAADEMEPIALHLAFFRARERRLQSGQTFLLFNLREGVSGPRTGACLQKRLRRLTQGAFGSLDPRVGGYGMGFVCGDSGVYGVLS